MNVTLWLVSGPVLLLCPLILLELRLHVEQSRQRAILAAAPRSHTSAVPDRHYRRYVCTVEPALS